MTGEDLMQEYQRQGGARTEALEQDTRICWGALLDATLGKIAGAELTEEIFSCYRRLLERLAQQREALVSESLGDWRAEYRQEEAQSLGDIIREMLDPALLYRGWPQ